MCTVDGKCLRCALTSGATKNPCKREHTLICLLQIKYMICENAADRVCST